MTEVKKKWRRFDKGGNGKKRKNETNKDEYGGIKRTQQFIKLEKG